jgi:hypothetical protein
MQTARCAQPEQCSKGVRVMGYAVDFPTGED